MVRIARYKLKEVKVALYCNLPDIRIKAEVTLLLVAVLAVYVAIAQLCIVRTDAQTCIITKLFTEKYTKRWFRPVKSSTGIQITKIMSGAKRYSKFTLLYVCILCIGTINQYS